MTGGRPGQTRAHSLGLATWQAAQTAELDSWLNTDIQYTDLLAGMQRKKQELAASLPAIGPADRLLDVGSGPVSLLGVLPAAREKVAVDTLIDAYEAKYARCGAVRYENQQSEVLAFDDGYFDMVFCLNALDHFADPAASLAEMIRVMRSGGTLLLEYENTTPVTRWFCRRGYSRPLSRFHPHLLNNASVISFCQQNGLQLAAADYRPAFTLDKVRYLVELATGRRQRGTYEKMVSSTASGLAGFLIHNLLGLVERLLYLIEPVRFACFTRLTFSKR